MRTVIYRMHLFNDNVSKHKHYIYLYETEGKGKESKIAERHRESVRDRAWQREEVVLVVKWAIGET